MKSIEWRGQGLSKLCLGTVQFGLSYGVSNKNGQTSLTESKEILDFVFSEGVNCLDTAQSYGDSEKVLGKYFSATNVEEKFIISKISSSKFVNGYSQVYDSVQESIERLNIPNLFAVLLHDSDLLGRWEERDGQIVSQLKAAGKIEYFGVSIYNEEEYSKAVDNPEIDLIQVPFNLFDHRALKNHWFDRAQSSNKLIIVRSVFLQGLLLMQKETLPSHLKSAGRYLKILDEICNRLDWSRQELALNYVDSFAPNSLLLFGCEFLDQAKENIALFSNLKPVSAKIWEQMDTALSEINEHIYNPILWGQNV